jgi:acetolactate synthase-1/3 small subunit
MSTHVLSLLVEDKPGLLTRVAGLFARRGFNIESLAVGHSEIDGLSRITVVVDVEDLPLEQVTKQVRVDNATRSQVLEAVNLFRARVVDVSSDALVIEVTGDSGKTTAFLKVLEPYGIKEIAQSGLLAIGRGGKSITERVSKS